MPSLGGVDVSDPLILDTEIPASPLSKDLTMEVETTIVPAQLDVTADSLSGSKKRKRINNGEERSDDRMKTPSLGGPNVSDPLILDTEAPASPQSEDLAMEVETTIVPAQSEFTANSRSKKRRRTNSDEERSDDRMKMPSLGGPNVSDPLILDTEAPASPQSEDLETAIVPAQLMLTADSRSKKRKRINSGEERNMPPSRIVKKLKTNQTVAIETLGFASVPNIAASARRAETIIKEGKTFDYAGGCDADVTPGIVHPGSMASDALSTNRAPDINGVNLISGGVIITRNDNVEMMVEKGSERRNKPKSGK